MTTVTREYPPACRICGEPIWDARSCRASYCADHRNGGRALYWAARTPAVRDRRETGHSAACAKYTHTRCKGGRYEGGDRVPCECDCHPRRVPLP